MIGKYTLIFSLLISSINYITSREDPPSPIFDDVIYGQPLSHEGGGTRSTLAPKWTILCKKINTPPWFKEGTESPRLIT